MANEAQKTEHSGPKKGRGAYWGRKKAAKHESNRVRREMDKSEEKPKSEEGIGDMMRKPGGHDWKRGQYPEVRRKRILSPEAMGRTVSPEVNLSEVS